MSRIRWYGPTLLLLVTVVLAMLLGPSMVRRIAQSYETARIEQVRRDLVNDPTLTALSDSFKDVAKSVRQSVTSISLLSRTGSTSGRAGQLKTDSNGSGWVYRYYPDFENEPDEHTDYIITNHHVVEKYILERVEQVVVRFDDGGEYRAVVVGSDKKSDIAVLEINRQGMIPAALAKEPAVQGEIVFAVGSPFQFEFSMSQGIVSATGRRLHAQMNNYENFIQTDAAINPGNSGGPLVNVRGEVVGMSTAIAIDGDPAREFSGLGFAIPIHQIVDIANKLIEDGEVNRGFIGVSISEVDFATAREMGFDGRGVLCHPVEGGPADRAGMRVGDIITHVDGRSVGTPEELRIEVSSHSPGIEVPIATWRRGKKIMRHVVLDETPQAAFGVANPFRSRRMPTVSIKGLGEFTLFIPLRARESSRAYVPGVEVLRVEEDSPGQKLGLPRSAIITGIDGRPINDLAGFVESVTRAEGDTVTLTVKRWDTSGEGRYVSREITLPAE